MLIKSKLPSTLQSMSLFLANKDTEYILFKPVKVSKSTRMRCLYIKVGGRYDVVVVVIVVAAAVVVLVVLLLLFSMSSLLLFLSSLLLLF